MQNSILSFIVFLLICFRNVGSEISGALFYFGCRNLPTQITKQARESNTYGYSLQLEVINSDLINLTKRTLCITPHDKLNNKPNQCLNFKKIKVHN